MRHPRRCAQLILVLLLCFLSSSCLWTHRVILRRGKPVTAGKAPVLLQDTRDGLNARVASQCDSINSFQATVQMTPSIGSVYEGHITDIRNVKAFVLFRKPGWIRIIGQLPVVGSKEFDMVSNGADFRFYEVSKNLFFTGSNAAPTNSKVTLENLRPQAFLSSLMICPAEAGVETPVLEDQTDEDDALYTLHYIRTKPELLPGRSVWFDRIDLSIVRQMVFDPSGSIISDTRYSKWSTYGGVRFPAHIDINRVKDGYGVTMDIQDMKMNAPLTDEQFELPQPEGAQLRHIGDAR